MESTNKNKRRVPSSHRRISSILNQSPTKLNASKGDIKRRMNVLVKNNRTLAVALQDARCELLSKEKLFEEAAEYFQNIMLAGVKMTHIKSALNSVLQDFDATLEMLKYENFNLLDFTVPFKSSQKFKNKMKKIAKAFGSVYEENSHLEDQENEPSNSGNSANPSIFGTSESSNGPALIKATKNITYETSSNSEPAILQAPTENYTIPDNSPDPIMPSSPCVKSEALADPCYKKETISITTEALTVRNDTCPPKLSLPSVIEMDLQKSYSIASSPLKLKNSSVVKEFPKIPENSYGVPTSLLIGKYLPAKKFSKVKGAQFKPKSSQNVLNSKIPRFDASKKSAIKETSLSDEINKVKFSVCPKSSNMKNINISQEINEVDLRRKTFVVKSLPEIAVALDEVEVGDMDNLEDELNSETSTSRKTFVVRSTPAVGTKHKGISNKRKTFVKKCYKNNSPKSNKNRRGTFVLTDVNKNCIAEGEILTGHSINSESEDLVKESNKLCAVTANEKFPPDTNDLCETTHNFQLSEKICFIDDNPEIKNHKSNSEELFHDGNSEEILKKRLENSPALEKEISSANDKRKTFIKKCNSNNSHKSVKDKRGTLVLTDINENCTVEDYLSKYLVDSECNDLVKEKLNRPFATTVDEALSPTSNDSCEITRNFPLLKKNSSIVKLEILNQESSSKKLLLEVNSKRTLKKKLVTSKKDVDKLISNQNDRVVEFDAKIGEIDELKTAILPQNPSVVLPAQNDKATKEAGSKIKDINKLKSIKRDVKCDKKIGEIDVLKSNILLQNPSIELPVKADKTRNEAERSASEAKTSKEDKSNCTVESLEHNNGNLSLKSIKEKAGVILSHVELVTGYVRSPIKETVILQTPSQPQVYFSKNSEEESVSKIKVNNNEEGECSLKSKEMDEKCKSNFKHATEVIKIDETHEKNVQPVTLVSEGEIIISDNDKKKRKSRLKKKSSYKMSLVPSDSECETISEVDNLENFEEEINSYMTKPPVRGKLSFSTKKTYIFNKKADAKIKPQKDSKKSRSCKKISNELTAANAVNKCCENNDLNFDTNEVRENIEENAFLHSVDPKGEKIEMGSKHVRFLNTQETIPDTLKSTENLANNKTNTDIEIYKNSSPKIFEGKRDKNINKTIFPPNYSPIISVDKCFNSIECDNKDRKEKADKNKFSEGSNRKAQSLETDNAKTTQNQTKSAKNTKTKKKDPPQNQPKKRKQVTKSDVGKENVKDPHANNKKELKPNSPNNNTLVVEAEIHPLPQTLYRHDKNIENTMNYEVAVVLNDIFQSKKNDLSTINKEKRDRNCAVSSLLTDNSSNIQMPATNKSDVTKKTVNEDLTEGRRSKRTKAINYAEPCIRKKMRR